MAVVTLPYDPTWQALDWAKKTCPSYITNAVHPEERHWPETAPFPPLGKQIDYFFSNEKEATMFALKWLG